MAEVHFIGSIIGAENFTLGVGQGLSVQYQVIADNGLGGGVGGGGISSVAAAKASTTSQGNLTGSGGAAATALAAAAANNTAISGLATGGGASTGWQLLEGVPFGTTHTDLTGTGYPVFSQPLDLHYTTSKIVGWPKIVVQVLQVSALGKYEVVAYGSSSLPMMPGRHASVRIPTWKPVGTVKEELLGWLFGTQISPRQWQLISDPNSRYKITAKSMGDLVMDITVLGRHFENYGITWG